MGLRLLANWKLNGSQDFYQTWFQEFNQNYHGSRYDILGLAPPSIFLNAIAKYSINPGIAVGAQNIDWLSFGERTGEISSEMVKDVGGLFAIIGHSERRTHFGETNAEISAKLDLASQASLDPILCIGESAEDRASHKTKSILEQQVVRALDGCSSLNTLTIAYEPVWAIGSGITPEPQEINSIHEMIKDVVQSRFSSIDLQAVLYGGSVNLKNSQLIFREKEIDGALVGGASLCGEDFAEIANIFNGLKGLEKL
ncbi:triose-phosphate isomerase [Gammaproteobacteria bacterium]|nr:triose-phosphate isomerase [Gammaproteobacteria bacterium]